jgi:GTPase SAR1 family protein
MKICVIGTHGVGKTSFASRMFSHAISSGIDARLIHEVARDCPFGINQYMTVDTTRWIITNQIARELFAESKRPKLIVCDRGAMDASMYARSFFKDIDDVTDSLIRASLDWMSTYDKIFYIKPSSRSTIVADGVRDTDVDYQLKVNLAFEDALRFLRIDYPEDKIITMLSDDIRRDFKNFFEELFHGLNNVRKH